MPYEGKQAAACHARKTVCLKKGYSPSWACDDSFKKKWPQMRKKGPLVKNGKYPPVRCGGKLPKRDNGPRRSRLAEHTVQELRAKAKKRGLTGYSRLRKSELIDLLRR